MHVNMHGNMHVNVLFEIYSNISSRYFISIVEPSNRRTRMSFLSIQIFLDAVAWDSMHRVVRELALSHIRGTGKSFHVIDPVGEVI